MSLAEGIQPLPADALGCWHLVYTKPQQEEVALQNLERQGYECYLPRLRVERLRRRKLEAVVEPLFPRYLFVRLDGSGQGRSWAPIRSTLGVQQLIYFGGHPAQADEALIDQLRRREAKAPAAQLFRSGDAVTITEGPFAGLEVVYQIADGAERAFVLLQLLHKPVRLQVEVAALGRRG